MKKTVTPGAAGAPTAIDYIKGNTFILIATIFFGANIPVVKFLIPEWMSSTDVTLVRLAGGCLMMWLASVFIKTSPIARGDMKRIAFGGGLGVFAFMYLFNLSLKYGDPIDISIIMTLPPVMIFVYDFIFRHQRRSAGEYFGVVLGLLGAALVILLQRGSGAATHHNLTGDLLALASAACYSFYLIVIEKTSHKYRPVSYLRWVFLFACIPALVLVPGFVHAPILASGAAAEWGYVAFIVLCPTFLSYILISPATKLIGSVVSIYQYLVPVFATIGSVMMHLAHLHIVQAVAMAAIIAGMLITEIAKRRRNRQ